MKPLGEADTKEYDDLKQQICKSDIHPLMMNELKSLPRHFIMSCHSPPSPSSKVVI